MMRHLIPHKIHPTIHEIDLARLSSKGIRVLFVDLDNTLVEYQKYEPSECLRKWIRHVKSLGYDICIVSNSRKQKAVDRLSKELGIAAIVKAMKPLKWGYMRAFKICDCKPGETAVIGDQVFTDILGGNRLGCHTILVRPLGRREFVGTRFVRILEARVLRWIHQTQGVTCRED